VRGGGGPGGGTGGGTIIFSFGNLNLKNKNFGTLTEKEMEHAGNGHKTGLRWGIPGKGKILTSVRHYAKKSSKFLIGTKEYKAYRGMFGNHEETNSRGRKKNKKKPKRREEKGISGSSQGPKSNFR